ncbi:peptidoglycan DD-metalloendopeptidase family protein [Myxococcota bacterium]|nr:peptidoglycan DD-metalloendopeptidase family protein [Myxococcota bacterium]MBU1382716.1 peptidoglycan DD-metalloendopeptidase family protein [Myxococcota bacterium]MBU1496012.1 peptidoglycan DD-metalloendopeptidase family protein [Myxococcota bacterium]
MIAWMLVIFEITSATTAYKNLVGYLEIEISSLKDYSKNHTEYTNLREAIRISSEERVILMTRRDSTVVRINGFKRAIKSKKLRTGKLISALAKLHSSSWGSPFLSENHVTVPTDGRYALLKILRREKSELLSLESDLKAIEQIREELSRSINGLENLIESLKIRLSDKETAMARAKFAFDSAHSKRKLIDKANYDSKVWQMTGESRMMFDNLFKKNVNFRLKRGILIRPVSGAFINDQTMSDGVFISAKPGDRVFAVENGIIRFTGPLSGYGDVVVIEHADSHFSLIGKIHEITVKPGDHVKRAQVIAKVAPLAKAPFVPVYYEIRKGTKYLNARIWLK